MSWNDDLSGTTTYGPYVYRVSVSYQNLTFGAADVRYLRPAAAAPLGFTARHLGGGTVSFQWQPVPGAIGYRLTGTGLSNANVAKDLSGRGLAKQPLAVAKVPPGPGSWLVAAVYPGGFSDPNATSGATVMVRFAPPHSTAWLAKNNGPGTAGVSAVHQDQVCRASTVIACTDLLSGVDIYNRYFSLWGDPLRPFLVREAVYANVTDLGVGRRTDCAQMMKTPTDPFPGFVTVCYATSHGPGPGEPGFGDPSVATRAAAGEAPATTGMLKNPWGGMPRSGSIIVMDSRGAVFLALSLGGFNLEDTDNRQGLTWKNWSVPPVPLPGVALDTEGPKFAPHTCLACHGGRYNVATNRVEGASLLPLDPGLLAFGRSYPGDRTYYDRRGQEESIRRINQVVMGSGSSPAVVDYVRGLYNGMVNQPGAVAQTDYVPRGWSQQSGLYRNIVKPYCGSCHLAASPNLSFATWDNFVMNKARIYQAVCVDRSMPHAEIPFREFWTKDTGPVFLPGLLAASLGYSSCP